MGEGEDEEEGDEGLQQINKTTYPKPQYHHRIIMLQILRQIILLLFLLILHHYFKLILQLTEHVFLLHFFVRVYE